MKFLHTSDWHLGINLHGISLMQEQSEFIEGLAKHVTENEIDAVVIAGDVFDRSVASPYALELYSRAMTMLCHELKVKVLICAGNHDGAERLASCNMLLRHAGLYIEGRLSQSSLEPVEIDGARFYLLPYFNVEEVRGLFPGCEIASYGQALELLMANMQLDSEYKNILVSHLFVSGAEISQSDRAAQVGGSMRVGADIFQAFDYVALGHLHKPQKIGANVYYCGSPIKYSFSEVGQEKGVSVVDTHSMSVQGILLTPKRDMRVIKGTYEQVIQKSCEDFVKVELTDLSPSIQILEALRCVFPNIAHISGKSEEMKQTSLSVDQISSTSPQDLVKLFCEEMGGFEPDKQQMDWFIKNLEI